MSDAREHPKVQLSNDYVNEVSWALFHKLEEHLPDPRTWSLVVDYFRTHAEALAWKWEYDRGELDEFHDGMPPANPIS